MVNWRRWINPGLIATFLIAILAVFLQSNALDRGLADQVRGRLSTDGQGWADVAVAGRSATILGTAPSVEAQTAALQAARRVSGVRSVTDKSDLLAIASPYVWSVRKVGSTLTLIGSIPSEGFRTSLLAATRRAMPRAAIHDEMRLARGAPAAFNSGTAFVLDRLGDLAEATATITDSTLSVSGVALDPETFVTAKNAFGGSAPAQLALGAIDILPARADPFVWSADYDGSALTLAGYVPNENVQASLLETAGRAFPDVAIVDEMRIASGGPDGFADAAVFAIGTLTRFDRGGVALDGMQFDITGKARTIDDYESVLETFSGALPRGMRVVSSAITPATVSAYGWRGEKFDGEVKLVGFVPSVQAKAEVVALAGELFGGDTLVDNVRIAAGEPRMDWIGGIKFAMGQLARLGRGTVVLGDRTFSVEGEAESAEAFRELLTANAQTLPASLALERADVVPPKVSPYRFVATRTPDAIRLDGYIASDEDRSAIISLVRSNYGRLKLIDNLEYASGAPDGFVRAAAVALQTSSRLAGGRSEILDANVNISGSAYYPSAAGTLADSVGDRIPAGFNVALSVLVRQPPQPVSPLRCRDLLQKALSVDRIEFDGGDSEISPDSFGALDRVAATIERCPAATIEVAAHTDSDGSSAHNLELSQARANAIREYLVDAGVTRERITSVGRGEDDPVADNSTEAGKAANRRIAFALEVPEDK